jgi:pimeloyl-ACP methyl ester carboxylesterase
MRESSQQMNDSEKTKKSGYAPVNGLNMYYEIHGGGGIPLVLIHGGGSTIESSFGIIMPLLSRNSEVIAVELQAHGRTSDRKSPESFEQDADDVAGLLKYLKITKASILGFSNGGTTTMQIAIRHPAIVHKIVVISASYQRQGMMPGFFEGLQQATLDDMPMPLKEAYLAVASQKELLQEMFEKDRDRMVNFEDMKDEQMRSIKAPTLLMAGDQDFVTPEHLVKMSHLIPGVRLAILPGTHGSFIGEACAVDKHSKLPVFAAALIEEFLTK